MGPAVYLRGDGNAKTGLGHIFRLISLFYILRNQFDCYFLIKETDIATKELILSAGCSLDVLYQTDLDMEGCNQILLKPVNKNDIIILDGYHFTTAYQEAIKKYIGSKLICIDDITEFEFVAEAVINHAGGINENSYKTLSTTKLYTGPQYALLRQEFYHFKKSPLPTKEVINRILVNFGGSDSNDFTTKTIFEILSILPNVLIHAVIGSAYGNTEKINSLALGNPQIKVHQNLNASQLVTLMKDVDIAICSASTISYEYCSISGLLFIIKTADNQASLYDFLINEKLAFPYKQLLEITNQPKVITTLREISIQKQQQYFDGFAGQRLLKVVNEVYCRNNIHLFKACNEDIDTYFNWANDIEVRKNSFNTDPIDYHTHCKWFESSISSPNSALYIFKSAEDVPVANIRFNIENQKAVLSYLIDERFRGLNLGKEILNQGSKELFKQNIEITKIEGFVKPENIASIKAFLSAGYFEVINPNQTAKHFIINRKHYDKSI